MRIFTWFSLPGAYWLQSKLKLPYQWLVQYICLESWFCGLMLLNCVNKEFHRDLMGFMFPLECFLGGCVFMQLQRASRFTSGDHRCFAFLFFFFLSFFFFFYWALARFPRCHYFRFHLLPASRPQHRHGFFVFFFSFSPNTVVVV